MNSTLPTILSVLMIILAIAYLLLYWRKRKNNTHLQMGYKIVFGITFGMLAVVMFNLLL